MNSVNTQYQLRFNRLTRELLECPRLNQKRFNKLNRERSQMIETAKRLKLRLKYDA